jgi:hypothetical protein
MAEAEASPSPKSGALTKPGTGATAVLSSVFTGDFLLQAHLRATLGMPMPGVTGSRSRCGSVQLSVHEPSARLSSSMMSSSSFGFSD